MATVLFAGFGDLGSEAGRLLAEGGQRVIALKRSLPAVPVRGVEYRAVDLRQPYTLPPALKAHPDAVVIAVSPTHHDHHDYHATYVGAVTHTLRALEAVHAHPKLVLFLSSTSVWSEAADLWISEDMPPRPDSWNGEIMLRAEDALFASPFPAATLRLAGIYGPGRYMMVRKAEAIIAGREPMPAPAWSNRIHRDDAARLIAFLVNRALGGVALERVYTGVDNEPSLNVDVLNYIGALLQDREPDLGSAAPPSNVSVGGKRVGNARARALGFQFRYPDFRAGYAEVVEAWKAEKKCLPAVADGASPAGGRPG